MSKKYYAYKDLFQECLVIDLDSSNGEGLSDRHSSIKSLCSQSISYIILNKLKPEVIKVGSSYQISVS
jgi:hypothetical protein